MNEANPRRIRLKINLSKYAGFCPGVRRADNTIRDILNKQQGNGRVYTLGQLIHNSIYTDELARLGASVISFLLPILNWGKKVKE